MLEKDYSIDGIGFIIVRSRGSIELRHFLVDLQRKSDYT